ncbi:MAG: xanthine dehydrogenase family protein molybdopterin-binding subunit [Spirochaetales bacterium]|nr:xanthine dehydrogenase family protein molybdopterin-binding subunit [Spirochaetales bacterium]
MAKFKKTKVEIEGKWQERETLVETDDLARWDDDVRLEKVGKPHTRVDGFERVSGTARYTHDVKLPGMLIGRILRSPVPHARIKKIDISAAAALPGVRFVLTNDTMGDLLKRGRSSLFETTVRFEGDEMAAVAAVDLQTAEEALALIKVDYEELPFVFDPAEALRSGAPAIRKGGNSAGEPSVYRRGNVDAGFLEADVVLDRTYSTSAALHNCLETHGAVARWEGDHLTVWHSTQNVFGVRSQMASALGLPLHKVRVIKEYIGGGFGSKNAAGKYALCAAILSRKTGRPVKIMLDRREENLAAGNRPQAVIHVRLGAKSDGRLTAIEVKSISGVGAYGEGSPPITGPARELYACENVLAEEQGALTNTGTYTAFRAPGYVEGTFALESAMDELAAELHLDPVEFRMKNYADRQQVRDLPYSTKNLSEAYTLGMKKIGWEKKRNLRSQAGTKMRGVGMASQLWSGGGTPPSYAIVRMNADGTFDVITGSQDLGTGTKTVFTQIAAEELGVAMERIHTVVGDTLTGPYSVLSAGSLTLPSVGPAVRMAAKDAKDQILEIAAEILNEPSEKLQITDGTIVSQSGSRISLDDVAQKVGNYMIIGKGARGPNPEEYNVNTFGAQFAEVEVDTETGEVRVLNVVAAHEFGRVINPLTLGSQIEGGVIQGLGFGLFEGRVMDRNTGKSVNPNLEDYKIPTALDVPDIDWNAVGPADPIATNIGAKGAGEPPIIPPAAAIANAVFDAIGLRIYDLPITPAKILDAVRMNGGRV